jgi:uncharacterized BrkB/YihY/UPF0761 family membrane protein
LQDLQRGGKMYFSEKEFQKWEDKYCQKHGREKFLKATISHFTWFLVLTIICGIASVWSLILGILQLVNSNFTMGVLSTITAVLMLAFVIVISTCLPLYKRKSKKCKEELKRFKD